MSYLANRSAYHAMTHLSDGISAAIRSLDVQVSWKSAQIIGLNPKDLRTIEPLWEAMRQHADLARALEQFTAELFCWGNFSLLVREDGNKVLRSDWREHAETAKAPHYGMILEAKLPPVMAGYGTPLLEAGVQPFRDYQHWQQTAFAQLAAWNKNPVGPMPGPPSHVDAAKMDAVLLAIGFGPWSRNDLPLYLHGAQLQARVAQLFETEILRPFCKLRGITDTPSLTL